MSLHTKKSYKLSVKRARRRRRPGRTSSSRLRGGRTTTTSRRSCFKLIEGGKSKLSDKLKALKELIPAQSGGKIVKADQLFQETADYIVLLRTRVVILQKLIELYGNGSENNENAVS
ncbi:transcription factor UPBEAT1 [Senna tora]|uniref:Transcription factor UPBEAT1 n=1 Tax=Senna tora TaxID=362788 RepID=A0A834SGW0_9FABA|nr:transcription factor UPBEAT1 [Senna tora]